MITGQTGLGFNPFHAVAKAAKGVAHVTTSAVKATGHGVAVGAKATAHGTVAVAKTVGHGALKVGEFTEALAMAPVRLALRPVKSRINTLTNRRANKIAWDARKSKTPTPAERAQARSWTKSELKKKLPHGPILALLAGPLPMPTDMGYGFGMSTNLGIAPAVIAALVPVFIEILNVMLRSFASNGQAPVSIGPQGQITLPPGMDPTMVPDSAADSIPMPDQAQAAAEAAAAGMDPGGAEGGGGGGGGGGGHGGKPNIMLIGGVIAAVVVVGMLMKPKSSASAKK